MKAPVLLASIGLLAALGGAASSAGARADREAGPPAVDAHGPPLGAAGGGAASGMRAVPITAGPGEPGHGWRYFTDPVAATAVVISPQGEHFFSDGDGLRLIAVRQPGR